MHRYARFCLAACGILAGAVAAIGAWQLFTPGPVFVPLGLMLAGGAPLAFLALAGRLEPARAAPLSVAVSILAGFGCVLLMTAVYRFGDAHQWALVLGTITLVCWLVCLRYVIRQGRGAR